MEIVFPVSMLVIGLVVGTVSLWFITRTKLKYEFERGRAEGETERATLIERNARDDEADVTTGFHAIEFLLWGQDFNADGPGNRSARDFVGVGAAARRREGHAAPDPVLPPDARAALAARPESLASAARAGSIRLRRRAEIAAGNRPDIMSGPKDAHRAS